MSGRSAEFRAAAIDIAPAAGAVVPLALLFGAVAAGKGMSPLEVGLMSAIVFAGGSQIAALELWTTPPPLFALALSTFLINARYVLMSASLAPKVGHLPLWQKLIGFHAMADENWALSEARAARHRLTGTYVFTMAAILFVNWVFWCALGGVLGPLLGDPKRIGADFAFTAIFIGLIAGFARSRGDVMVIVASAAAAALTYVTIGAPWHVLAGAFAGIGSAALAYRPQGAAP